MATYVLNFEDILFHMVAVEVSEYLFTSLSKQSWQYRDRMKPEVGIMSYSNRMISGLLLVHSTIDSTVHSRPLNSLEHCICTTSMTNSPPGRDSLSFEPQPDRTSHRGRGGGNSYHLNLIVPCDNDNFSFGL